MNECRLLGYVLGTCDGWDGDIEAIQFEKFVPDLRLTWPSNADVITIDLLTGTVQAWGEELTALGTWPWADFIKPLT